jgi:ribonucleoside-triphosphate reductase
MSLSSLKTRIQQENVQVPSTIIKRDGTLADFDVERINQALTNCYAALDKEFADLDSIIVEAVSHVSGCLDGRTPCVEDVQNAVEVSLVSSGHLDAARAYMAYRDKHKTLREGPSEEIKKIFTEAAQYFPTDLQQFQFFDKYSRFNWDLGRRETWIETVDRVMEYFHWLVEVQEGKHLPDDMWYAIREGILGLEVMPSMRCLAMAGEAARRNGLSIYNCSAAGGDSLDSFVESMIISMAGCGIGFSVERQFVSQLPAVAPQTGEDPRYHLIEDSSEGWAEALRYGLQTWFAGSDVTFEYGLIRPAGAPLKVKGGRASGPEPLRYVLDFCRHMLLSHQGQKLSSLDVHDMLCVVGGAAVSGGVRRTAAISLFDWDDEEMRNAKSGDFPEYRWNANNSAVWPDGLSREAIVSQMTEMVAEGRGEPGIFSRENANRTIPARREPSLFLTNPCGEILLRHMGLCNLSIAVARHEDSVESLYRKVELATIIGTIQSLVTNFPGLRPEWKQNCIEERLLGVDITGQADCPLLDRVSAEGEKLRQDLTNHAIEVNKRVAAMLEINQSAAITCNKPSGNSSQLLDCASGIHRRWSPYYLRRTRVNVNTPVFEALKASGVPMTPENGSSVLNADTYVVAWPVKSPEGSITRSDMSVVDQCNFWLLNKVHWTEHNPSVTILYQEHEVQDMIDWVYDHRDLIGGMAFLPADNSAYEQAPYEEITQEEYEAAARQFPSVDFSLLAEIEKTDLTDSARLVACMAAGGDC